MIVQDTYKTIIPSLKGDGISLEQNPYKLQQDTYRCKKCSCGSYYLKRINYTRQEIQCQNCGYRDTILITYNPIINNLSFSINLNQIQLDNLLYQKDLMDLCYNKLRHKG